MHRGCIGAYVFERLFAGFLCGLRDDRSVQLRMRCEHAAKVGQVKPWARR